MQLISLSHHMAKCSKALLPAESQARRRVLRDSLASCGQASAQRWCNRTFYAPRALMLKSRVCDRREVRVFSRPTRPSFTGTNIMLPTRTDVFMMPWGGSSCREVLLDKMLASIYPSANIPTCVHKGRHGSCKNFMLGMLPPGAAQHVLKTRLRRQENTIVAVKQLDKAGARRASLHRLRHNARLLLAGIAAKARRSPARY